MKKIHRVLALLLAALMALGLMTTAFAATDSAPIIDPGKKASLSIYKYDITTAGKDGAWDAESYVSTGLHDGAVTDKLSKYAIQGVEFTYLRIADITMNNELVDGQRQVGVLYGFDSSDRSTTVLSAIGLTGADAHKTEGGVNYYTSDALSNKLSTALTANATTVKNALETAVKNGGVAMSETDVTGHTSASDMEQGLYLVVETRVPENVTSTCNPFFVSLPMTTIDGAAWNYDVSVYPKNQTGNPNLEKTVRENKNSTGKHNGSLTDIKDSYAHTATASAGDVVDYQIISTLPTITSKASSLSEYTYADTAIFMPCGTPTLHAVLSRMWMSKVSAKCWATAMCGSPCKPMSMSPCGISSRRCRASASCRLGTLRRQKFRQAQQKTPHDRARRRRFPK